MKIILKYSSYIVVFVLSFSLSFLIKTNELLKGFFALPAAASLFSFLYEIYRDNRAHERALELQNKQQDYVLATASHMADVAYDKHVLFCEAYISRVQSGFQELLREGPSRNALNIGRELVQIRQEHSPWLTKEIEIKLKPFEDSLIMIGAKNGLIDHLPVGEERNSVITEVYKFFGLILGHEKPENEAQAGISITEIIEDIREILGINILTDLRQKVSKMALERIG